MKTRGIRTFGALFLVLLFLMGAWAVAPGWSAQAQGKPIQGYVADADKVDVVPSATVTLTNVHSLVNMTATTGPSTGKTYQFTSVSPGYYSVKVHADGYFDNATQTFRYDGLSLLQYNFNLTKWKDRNQTLSVLVTETTGGSHNESVFFPRYTVTLDETASTFATPPDHVILAHKPVVSVREMRWSNVNMPSENHVLLFSEYALADQWSGTVNIFNSTIGDHLRNTSGGPHSLKATYVYTVTTGHLNYTPMLPAGYVVYKNDVIWPGTTGDWNVDVNEGTLAIYKNFIWGTDRVSMSWNSTGAIPGATVTLYNSTKKQVIETHQTNSTGWALFGFWPGSWEMWASKQDYQTTVIPSTYIATSYTQRIQLPFGIYVDGFVSDSNGYLYSGNVAAYLYNTATSAPMTKKVLTATVSRATFTFRAYPGNFLLILDADGHKASVSPVGVTGNMTVGNKILDLSTEEKVDATLAFASTDWNRLNVYQNFSLNRDSQIPGLDPPYLRDAFLQIDYTLGDGDGQLEDAEIANLATWLLKNGPGAVNTDKYLTTNGKMYLANFTNDPARADTEYYATTDIDKTATRTHPILINTTTHYYTKDTPLIPYGKPRYYVNFTGAWDTNTTVYHNNTYTVDLPRGYEMTSTTFLSQGLRTENFTRILLDPGLGSGTARADMIVEQSENGSARARVKGPAGYFQELNTTAENYTAVVMANYNMTYTASDSIDPIGNIADANFTWVFESVLNGTRWGIDAVYNYTAHGEYTVNLTVREAGGNYTYRDIKIIVDDVYPVARIWTNLSIGGSGDTANGTTIRLNEGIPVRVDAVRSLDYTYNLNKGYVAEAHWDFDGDGIEDSVPSPGLIYNQTYNKPGNYTLKMWVIDGVGHRSVNATMKVIVNDTTPPSPDFVIYDSSNEVVTTLFENRSYLFNASATMDNYDSLANMTFTWDFGDGTTNFTAKGLVGYNVTHTYVTFNNSYTLSLNVTDTGFLGNTPNYKVLQRSITVQVESSRRPNIAIKPGSFVANPNNPEEGTDVVITVTVTNEANRARASDIRVRFYVRTGTTYAEVSIASTFYDSGAVANNSLESGKAKQIQFVWKADISGARPVKVTVSDVNEPYTWVSDNSIESSISVREAVWKLPAIIAVFVFIIFGLPIIYYLVKKYRAGELKLPRREKGEKGEKEESKKEEAAEKKEKKRL